MTPEEEDKVLRVWTPLILRASLTLSTLLLIAGMVAMALVSPRSYAARYHQLQRGAKLVGKQGWGTLLRQTLTGEPRALLTVGLMVLTMVPLGRVGFTFFFFLKQKDHIFSLLTAIVLGLLVVGVILGRVG